MKIAFYIEDGLEQIVLTPQSKVEHSILAKLHDGTRNMSIKTGSFYECEGGWIRTAYDFYDPYELKTDKSTIIVLRPVTHDREGKPIDGADKC